MCIRDRPSHIYIRDLEGTKLLPEQWPDTRLTGLTERAKASVRYSEKLGVKRIGYCLLINNLAQSVFFLAREDAELEARLWGCLGSTLKRYQQHHGNTFSERLIRQLLDGAPWPNKTNLLNRVLKRRDRASEYVPLPSPFAHFSNPQQPKSPQCNSE